MKDPRPVQEKFLSFAGKWKKETIFESDLRKIITNRWYREIIKLGWDVVPILIHEMKINPDHWHTALVVITKENPAKMESAGDTVALGRDWNEWWSEHIRKRAITLLNGDGSRKPEDQSRESQEV